MMRMGIILLICFRITSSLKRPQRPPQYKFRSTRLSTNRLLRRRTASGTDSHRCTAAARSNSFVRARRPTLITQTMRTLQKKNRLLQFRWQKLKTVIVISSLCRVPPGGGSWPRPLWSWSGVNAFSKFKPISANNQHSSRADCEIQQSISIASKHSGRRFGLWILTTRAETSSVLARGDPLLCTAFVCFVSAYIPERRQPKIRKRGRLLKK